MSDYNLKGIIFIRYYVYINLFVKHTYIMFRIKDKISCEKNNPEYFRMLIHFDTLVSYTMFLIDKNNFKEIYRFYNYMFERYFPENTPNLNNIDYKSIFTGKYAQKTIRIYKNLLELWIILQEKTILDSDEIPALEKIQKNISDLLKEF